MKIAIIDDERPARSELLHHLKPLLPAGEFLEADGGASGLELVSNNEFDIIFLDINLGDINGTSLAQVIKKIMPDAHIVFVTAFSEYAVKAFEIGVSNYLLKPVSSEQLEKVVQRYQQELDVKKAARAPGKMAISSNKKVVMLDVNKIVYVETDNRGSIVHTTEGDFKDSVTIGEYQQRLSDHRFYRVHKCYLVNLVKVREIIPWHNNCVALIVTGFENTTIPVGRNNTKVLKQYLGI